MMLKELELLASKLKEVHLALSRAISSLSDEEALAIRVTPEWSVQDIVAHLASANRGMFGIAQRTAKGESPQLPPGYNNDTFNARQVVKRKTQSLSQVRDELNTTLDETIAFFEGVTSEQLELQGEHPLYGQVTLARLLEIIYNHEITHSNEIVNAIHQAKK